MFLLHQPAIRSRMFLPSRMLRHLLQVLLKDQGQTILFSNSQKSDKLPGRSTPFRAGMGLLLDLLQVLGRKMRIDLRGRKAGMTEHFLYTAQVRSTHEQIAGKGVAHRMG